MSNFSDFHLDPTILSAISKMGYEKPTPIQEKAIPAVLAGGDVMGAAQTGTGKTAGFGLPLIQRILPKANSSMSPARHPVRALILTPTRELADQVSSNLVEYASDTPLRVGVVYGGVDIRPQSEMLRQGVEILTATPGRLLDHVQARNVQLNQVEIVVLDEADRMLDMGFLPDISRILECLPQSRQSLLFSATFSPEIKKLAKTFLKDHPTLIEVARQNQTSENITQEVFSVQESEKLDVLIDILKNRGQDNQPMKQVIVFVNAKNTCRYLTRTLERVGINADAIHGDKTQEERQAALEGFKMGAIHVLVATDVAARGLDIKELPVVINYDVPFCAEDYVHRIGRTGRAGSHGLAIMLSGKGDEKNITEIEKLTKQTFDVQPLRPLSRGARRDLRRGQSSGSSHGSRRDRDGDRERVDTPEDEMLARERARAYVPPSYRYRDSIFDTPYRERPPRYNDSDTLKIFEPEKPKQRPVAALLGGIKLKRF